MIEKVVDIITEFFGGDPTYYDVDANALAWHLIDRGMTLRTNPDQLTIEEVIANEGN